MNFEALEKQIQTYIASNHLNKCFKLLNESFDDSQSSTELSMHESTYNSLLSRQRLGTIEESEVILTINKLQYNLLQFLASKKDYYKYHQQTFGEDDHEAEEEAGFIKVFFSVASPHNDSQQHYIEKLNNYFNEHGISLETLSDWNDDDPLLPIMKCMKDSCGCLVLAFERMYVDTGYSKRGSKQESEVSSAAFSSAWLQIEAALARSYDLPLIILKEKTLKNDGLIDDGKQEWGIVLIDQDNFEEIGHYPVKNFLLSWIKQVKKFHKQNSNS